MRMEVKITVDGEEYLLKGIAVKLEHIEEDYIHNANVIKKAIAKIDKPRTIRRITDEVRRKDVMSQRLVKKVLDIYTDKFWEVSKYRNPNGGKPTDQYKLIKEK